MHRENLYYILEIKKKKLKFLKIKYIKKLLNYKYSNYVIENLKFNRQYLAINVI